MIHQLSSYGLTFKPIFEIEILGNMDIFRNYATYHCLLKQCYFLNEFEPNCISKYMDFAFYDNKFSFVNSWFMALQEHNVHGMHLEG